MPNFRVAIGMKEIMYMIPTWVSKINRCRQVNL